jgi:[protein-PII] uridylyltransferase
MAKQFATKLGLDDAQADLVEFLVSERELFPAAASRLSMGNEESVLELTAHIGSKRRADALYLLAAANAEEPTHRAAMDELYGLVTSALLHPELTSAEATDIAEARRQTAIQAIPLIPDPIVRRLLEAAPRRYLLAHSPETIARHGRMLEPPPTRNEVRIHADPHLERGEWTVHIVALDRPGVLAAITRAFAACGVPVTEAWISTWSNGFAVDVFRATASRDADWEAVRLAAVAALTSGERNGGPSPIQGRIDVDNVASPWHTIVEVRAQDRTGLLHRVAEALARAGLQIHHATVRTVDGVAVDTFLVTDRHGHKLDAQGQRALHLAFEGRVPTRWTPRRLWLRPTKAKDTTAS